MRVRHEPERFGEWAAICDLSEDPTTMEEALSVPTAEKWKKAMESELEVNEVWTLADLPPGKQAVGSKWVEASGVLRGRQGWMDQSLDIRQDWSPGDFHRGTGVIMTRHSAQW